MNLMLGRHRLGRYRLAGKATSAAVLVVDYPEIDDNFYINIFNSSGTKTGVITSDIFLNPLSSVEFEMETTGCGAFTLVLDKESTISLAYNQRIDIYLYGDYYPWYSGYVAEIPKPGTTEETYTYKGKGYFTQLNSVLINRIYENYEISNIVKNLMSADIVPKTDVLYRGSKIYPTAYTATKLRFNWVKAADAIKTLAEVAVNYVYGVDEYRELFFKPLVTTINEDSRFWVGNHIAEFKPKEDPSKIVNFFYVKYGTLSSGGSNLYSVGGVPVPFQDATSIAAYGQKEDILTIPNAFGTADVERWAYAQLNAKKNPPKTATIGKFHPDVLKRKIKPEGNVAITSEDGLHNYEYPLKTVKRKLDSNGQQLTMTMGDYSPILDSYTLKMYRDIKNAEQLQATNNEQLSGVS